MRTDNKPTPKTYTANSVSQPTTAKHEGKILSESTPVLAKTAQPSSAKSTQNINLNVNRPFTNRAI